MVFVSAPGKCIIIGEHAVVYGEPAIIAAIDKRCFIEAEQSSEIIVDSREFGTKKFHFDDIIEFTEKINTLWLDGFEEKDFSELFRLMKSDTMNPVKAALGKVLERLNIKSGVKLSISSDIPIGAGIGSGAALSVALTKAAAEAYKKSLSVEGVNGIAFEIEKFIHGTPSGGDNSACCYGGLIWFKRSQPKNIIRPLTDLPTLENFVLVYTKKPEKTTGELVQLVRTLEQEQRNKSIKKIGKLAYEMLDVLKNRNFVRMKEIINETQKNLAELGVSIPEIDEIHEAVKKMGGAAKICGAGGGGTMLCYHENKQRLIETIQGLGYEPWDTELGVEGVRVEK